MSTDPETHIKQLHRRAIERERQAKEPVKQALRDMHPEAGELLRQWQAHAKRNPSLGVTGIVVADGCGGADDDAVVINGIAHRLDAPLLARRDVVAWWRRGRR